MRKVLLAGALALSVMVIGAPSALAHGGCIAEASITLQADDDVKGLAEAFCQSAHDDTRATVEVFRKLDGGSWASFGSFVKITHGSTVSSAPFTVFGGCNNNAYSYYATAKVAQRQNGGTWHNMDSDTSVVKHC